MMVLLLKHLRPKQGEDVILGARIAMKDCVKGRNFTKLTEEQLSTQHLLYVFLENEAAEML